MELEHGVGTQRFITSWDRGYWNSTVILPADMTCSQCILQWTYTAGNDWGTCENGTSSLGCGPQETFRACSDIAIESKKLFDVEAALAEKEAALPYRRLIPNKL